MGTVGVSGALVLLDECPSCRPTYQMIQPNIGSPNEYEQHMRRASEFGHTYYACILLQEIHARHLDWAGDT